MNAPRPVAGAETIGRVIVLRDTMADVPVHRSPDLVGRDAELEEISSQLGIAMSGAMSGAASDAVAASPADAVLLAGDAGVGKTRLLTELRDRAVEAGWEVVAGHCLDLADSALPYLPFSEMLGRLATRRPEAVEAAMVDHPVLGRLQPGRRIRSGAEGADGVLERGDLFEAVHALLERTADAGPLLVIVEDAHWADQSTRDLISFLLARPTSGTVRLVVSYRADDLHRRHPLRPQVAEWGRVPGVARLQLEPLAAPDVRRLVRLLHPDPMPEASVGDIVTRAEGNAFFVEELVGATWATGGVPTDLAEVLLVRLDRLEDAARRVVRTASAAGRQVSHSLLAAASGTDPDALDDALRQAVEMNVLVPVRGDSYAFRHALLGEAVYDDLLPGERVRIHAAYAEALRSGEVAGTAAELARHARLGQDARTGLFASIEAGEDAMRVAGPDEAAQHYEQALALLASSGVGDVSEIDVPHLVIRTADALIAAGHLLRARSILQSQLDQLPADAPDTDRGQLMAALATVLAIVDSPEDELEMARRAVELVAEGSPAQRARALAAHARILAGRLRIDEAREVATEALALTQLHDMPRLGADILTTMAMDKRGLEDAVGRALGDAVEKARASGATNAELRARYLLGLFHQDRAEFSTALALFEANQERGVELGIPWSPYCFESRFMRGQVLISTGRWDEALSVIEVAGESPPPVYEAMLAGLEAQVRVGRGDAAAIRGIEEGRRYWHKEGMVALVATTAMLELAEQRADGDAARKAYDELVTTLSETWHDRFQARMRFSALALGVLGTAAESLSAADREAVLEEARELHDDGRRTFDHHREQGITFGPEALAWVARLPAELLRFRWLAQVDPPDEEELVAAWGRAEGMFEEYGHVYELARVRARLAAVLRATGDLAGARRAGDAAREVAHRLGAQPLLDELVALGSSAAAPRTEAAEALTPREGEILGLVAQGRSNGEIGKQLFISTKTVSVHVSNILAKLNAASRTEAAAIARRRGLL